MTGAAGFTHCGRWRPVPPGTPWTDATRLVCTLPAGHRFGKHPSPHHSGWSGWLWFTNRTPLLRVWVCRGVVDEAGNRCGRTVVASESDARVQGWRIGRQPDGQPDPLCPACGRPDPVAAAHCRALEAALHRR